MHRCTEALIVRTTLGGKATVRPATTLMNAASPLYETLFTTATSPLILTISKASLYASAARGRLAMDLHVSATVSKAALAAPMSTNVSSRTYNQFRKFSSYQRRLHQH